MPDESLKTVLGFEAAGAIGTLQRLSTAIKQYNLALFQSAVITKKYNSVAGKVDAQFKKQAAAVEGTVTAQNNLITSSKKGGAALKDIGNKTEAVGTKTKKLAKDTKKAGGDMILTWKSVTRIFAIQVIHQMISKMTSAMRENIGAAIDLEVSLAEIQTIGGVLEKDFEGLSNEIRKLSDTFGISAEIVAEGIYETLSNQVAEAAGAFTFFAESANFAIASVTSADAAVNLLSSTINAFGYNASQTREISGKLFRTIDLGRIRGEEFANTFGRIAVLAYRLNISLEEVLASIATLTIAGLRYNEAFTLINNIMLKLIRPTDALKQAFDEMGLISVEAGIQAYGFQGLLAKLAEKAGDSATELGELFGRVRAIRGALGLTGAAAKTFVKNLKEIEEAGGETIMEAKEIIFRTNAKQVQIELEKLRNVILFDFGRKALAVINKTIVTFGGLVNIVKALGTGLGVVAIGLVALGIATYPVVAGILAIGVAFGGLAYTYQHFTKTAIEGIKERQQAEMKAILEINAAEAKKAEQRVKYFRTEFSELQKYLVERLKLVYTVKQNAIEIESFISNNFNQQLSNRQSAFSNFVSAISKSMEQAKTNINKSQEDIFTLQQKLSKEIFEGEQRRRDETRQVLMNIQRGVELSRKASRLFREGHQKRAQQLFTESKQLLEQAKQIGINIENVSIERRARDAIKNTIQDQINLQRDFSNIEAQRFSSLSKQLPMEKARANRISFLVEKLKEFAIFSKEGIIQFATEEEAMQKITPWLNALQQEFDEVGANINVFKRLEETGARDLEKALLKVIQPLEDVFTGQPITLQFAYKERARLVFKDLQDIADKIPIDIKLRLEKLGFDVSTLKGIEDASKGLVKVFQTIERSIRASAGLKGEQKKLDTQIRVVGKSAEAVRNSFADQIGVIGTLTVALKDPVEVAKRLYGVTKEGNKELRKAPEHLQPQINILEQINRSAKIAREQITGTFNPTRFRNALISLEGVKFSLEKVGQTDTAASVQFLIEKLKEAAETSQNIQQITRGTEIQFGETDLQKLEEIFRTQGELGRQSATIFQSIGTAAQEGTSIANTAFESTNTNLWKLEDQAYRTAAAIRTIGTGIGTSEGPITASLGGMIYRQYGGFIPKGTDTIPAMLSPGEFVVNAKSSRQFFSQLVAMNAGTQPVYREQGGPVTNVGDVNITVQGATKPQQTARETMSAFKREMRRQTSSLN